MKQTDNKSNYIVNDNVLHHEFLVLILSSQDRTRTCSGKERPYVFLHELRLPIPPPDCM